MTLSEAHHQPVDFGTREGEAAVRLTLRFIEAPREASDVA